MIKAPIAAVVDSGDRVRSLIVPRDTDVQVTEEIVKDDARLARLLQQALRDVAALERRPCPRRLDFEDVSVSGDGVTVYRFPHGFGGRVRWWVVDQDEPAALKRSDETTDDVLALVSEVAAVVTVRVEEVGG